MPDLSELNHLRELIEQRLDNMDRALELQATEYERRLADLNHAHAATLLAQSQTVSREIWDQFNKEYDTFKDSVNKQLTVITTRSQTWIVVGGLILAIMQLIIAFWPKFSVIH